MQSTLTELEKQQITRLVRHWVVPAIGCTEPICVALAVSRATEVLGTLPDRIEARLSANILKNAMGVGIPGTGMVGLPIAIALGALIGQSELGLEVLRHCDEAAVERGKAYIAEERIDISLKEDAPEKLYVEVIATAPDGTQATVVLAREHTHYVYIAKGNEVILDEPLQQAGETEANNEVGEPLKLTLRKVGLCHDDAFGGN